jgi:hypothetical protein
LDDALSNFHGDQNMTSDADFYRYEDLCRSLEQVQREFEQVAIAGSDLFHMMFEADDPIEQRSWEAFIAANSGRVGQNRWERWEPLPDGSNCGCYYGSEKWLDHFQAIATSGYLIIRDIQFHLNEGHQAPDGCRLKLPRSQGHVAWLELLYETAMLNTALLRSEVTCWDIEPGRTAIDLSEEEIWRSDDEGNQIPAHPLLHSLHLNLFRSSAEAISYWFCPDEAVPVGDLLADQPPVFLPRIDEQEHLDEIEMLDEETAPSNITTSLVTSLGSEKPKWGGKRLWVRGECIKRYRNAAPDQKTVLDAFEAADWPSELPDPLDLRQIERACKEGGYPSSAEMVGRRDQRRQTVAELNKAQDHIRFRCSGDGFAVEWEWRNPIDERLCESSPDKTQN